MGIEIGGISISTGVEVMKLYTSTSKVYKSHFYGNRTEYNLSATVGSVSVGVTGIYGKHSYGRGYTIGYGVTVGVDAMPFNIGWNVNRGVTVDRFYKLDNAMEHIFD